MGNLDALPILPRDNRKFHIRIVEHGKNLAGALRGVIGLGQKFFHLSGQGMIPPGENDFQRPLKMTDSVIRYHVPFQKLPVHGQNFRHQEGAVLSRPVGQRLGPGKHILVSLHRGILVGTHPGIDIKTLYLLGKPVVERKAGIESIRAVSQPPLVGSIFAYFPGSLFKHLLPLAVLRHHILQFPGILTICFASFFHAEHTPSNTILNGALLNIHYFKLHAKLNSLPEEPQ